MAPPTGLEPVTPWLTVRCSTDWAKEEYVELVQFQAPYFVGFYWDCSRVIRSTSSTDWAKEEYKETAKSDDLAVRCWHWVIFPIRRQTSIFTIAELNFCVRNGNRWTLCIRNTNYIRSRRLRLSRIFVSALSYFPGPSPDKYLRHCRA